MNNVATGGIYPHFTQFDPDEPLWDKLVQQIIDGNVIPVIGADLLIDNATNLHDVIIESLFQYFKVDLKHHSFSELVYSSEYKNSKFKKDDIYYMVNSMFSSASYSPSQRLIKLLSVRQFPFVITTSFTPIVEQAMSDIWKDELKVMRFNNNPKENDDIITATDLRKPTVYYMFGKVGESAHKYVLTDTDMLDFVSSWLSDTYRVCPKNLCNELEKKYLLMLGNNYGNWLFRFIWYSIRKQNLGRGMLAYDGSLDESLINFLNRTETFTKQNITTVIDQIVTRVDKKLQENESTKFKHPENNADVFISYSRSDSDVAEKVYKIMSANGKKVWYDRFNLTEGGYFMDEIKKAIRTAKYFVPIFSQNIEKEKNDSHVYRIEWDEAIEVARSMGRTFIIPIAEEGFDFYNAAINEKLQQHNAIIYSHSDDSIERAVVRIMHKMNQD